VVLPFGLAIKWDDTQEMPFTKSGSAEQKTRKKAKSPGLLRGFSFS